MADERDLQTVQRLTRVESSLGSLEHVLREHTRTSHAALVDLGEKLAGHAEKLETHMITEEKDRRQWGDQLAMIAERVRSLPEWRQRVEDRLRSLQEWRAYLTGAVGVVVLLLVPLIVRWVDRVVFATK